MSEGRIIRRSIEDPRRGKTDWARVDAMTEEEIEQAALSDPDTQPTDEEFWKDAVWIPPLIKKSVSLRLDKDVLDWFKGQGPRYQTRINAVLRLYMEAQKQAESAKSGSRR